MKELLSAVWEDIVLYNNGTFIFPLFLVAFIYLWVVEKDISKRNILLYLSMGLILVFINPIYSWIGLKVDNEAYYRVWWTLPIGIVVCYSAVRLVMGARKLLSKVLIIAIAVLVIVMNGKLVYKNTIHFKATNLYQMPQVVIDVADALKVDGYIPNVALPAELLPFIRQYSADIIMPYGRNILVSQWAKEDPLYDCMEAEIYVAETIAAESHAEMCLYVVLSSIKPMEGKMEEYGFSLQGLVGGYYIYRNDAIYEVLIDMGYVVE